MPKDSNMSVRDTAIRMGCTICHIYNLVRTRRLAGAFKRDGEWLVPESSIVAYRQRVAGRARQSRSDYPQHTAHQDQAAA
jgi:hypothetical protein